MTTNEFLPLWVVIGAIPGALSRYYLTLFVAEKVNFDFPLGTLLINISGAFLMGFLAPLLPSLPTNQWLNEITIAGFVGSYTTFSTYILDLFYLSQTGKWRKVFLYGLGTPLGGLLSVELGIALAQLLS
ncbi:MAG: fluoride efflux transporter CrcB [Pseudanabaenaceae cyanobacterium SKYGB_i_bin29]|nr:fluoride efflux transporter CrcB [Pseudanabaenaceae cyanobacterium SKYG29]MDW8420504.1 fluoride efflux transporter CrcB [Pseudanabaenaceae cyanobacterium SKYGB_i_bin29]